MALILHAVSNVRRMKSGLAHHFSDFNDICRERGHAFRERMFTPLVTISLFCLQILYHNTSIVHLRQLSGMDFCASSYSDARKNLPLPIFTAFMEIMTQKLADIQDAIRPKILCGRRIVIIDAFTFSMPDMPELLDYFGLPPGQKIGIGYPVGKVMAVIDEATGMLVRLLCVNQFTHDMRGAIGMLKALKKDDILLGDAAFCSFAHLCLLQNMGVDGVFCLHQRRPKKAGKTRWTKPKTCPVWMTEEQHLLLPAYIDVRVVKLHIEQKGFKTRDIFIATTLLDEVAWPDDAITTLYRKRWDIETCFGYIKTMMKLDVLKCRTVDGIHKELVMYMIVYNIVRMEMLRAAEKQKVNVRRISFMDAMRRLAARMLGLHGSHELIVNPSRPGRQEPRRRRRRAKNYSLLTVPRNQMKCA